MDGTRKRVRDDADDEDTSDGLCTDKSKRVCPTPAACGFDWLVDDVIGEIARVLVSPHDYYALARTSRRLHGLLTAPHVLEPMVCMYFHPWKRIVVDTFWAGLLDAIQTRELCMACVQRAPLSLEYVHQQTYDVCMAAVRRDGRALRYVRLAQTADMCMAAVQSFPLALSFVDDQTDALRVAAVQRDGHAIGCVRRRTRELCLMAVRQKGAALQYLFPSEKTEEICQAAVEQHGAALQHVKPEYADSLAARAIATWPDALEVVPTQTPEMCLAVVRRRGLALRHVRVQTHDICLAAVKADGLALVYVKQPTYAIAEAAVRENAAALRYVPLEWIDLARAVLRRHGCAIRHWLHEQTEELARIAVTQDPWALAYVAAHAQTTAVCEIALRGDGMVVEYVHNLTLPLLRIAIARTPSLASRDWRAAHPHLFDGIPDDDADH
jgi:hypothetical protein